MFFRTVGESRPWFLNSNHIGKKILRAEMCHFVYRMIFVQNLEHNVYLETTQ